MLLSGNNNILHFFNESFSVDSCNKLRKIIIGDVQKWEELFKNNFNNEFNNILHVVKGNFSSLKLRADKIHDDNILSDCLLSINDMLLSNRIPSFNIINNRLHTESKDGILFYLFGLFGGSIESIIRLISAQKYLSFYLAGVGDQEVKLNRSKSLEALYKEAKINIKDIKKGAELSVNLAKDYQKHSDNLLETDRSLNSSLLAQEKNKNNNLNDKLHEVFTKIDIKYAETVSKLDAVIPRAEKAVQEKIKLISLQKLWDEKHSLHEEKEREWFKFLKWSIALALLMLIGGILLISLYIPSNNNRVIDMPIVATAVLAVLVFWFIRLITKIWLSHSHLKNDAHERSVMTQTYLALMVGQDLSSEQNNMVFNAMFRPIKDGIVKDDGPNSPVLEIVDKLRKPSS